MKKLSFLAVTILSLVWQGQARADSFGQSSVDAGVRPFYEQAADPSVSSNLGMLYSKDASGITQLFYKTDDGTVYQITPLGAGTGDVVGPASATDNCFPRFNTTTGKLIQNSGVCADDSNNVTGAASVTATTFTGALSGNSTTATALAANGANCSAGSFPLGVDASGAAESCTVAPTGTVTSVATGAGLTGGPITTTGTVALKYTDTIGGNPAMNAGEALFGTTGILFEGSTADAIEGLLTVADPTASDKTWTLPNTTGTLVTTGDTGTVTSGMIFDGTIAGGDLASNIAISTSSTLGSTNTNGAGASANPIDITSTLGIMDGSDTYEAIDINLTNANHTGSSNVVTGLDISSITGDSEAVETAINIGNGWDTGLNAGNNSIVTTGQVGIGGTPANPLHIVSPAVSGVVANITPGTVTNGDIIVQAAFASPSVSVLTGYVSDLDASTRVVALRSIQRNASGDNIIWFDRNGSSTQDWTVGEDVSDSSAFKISQAGGTLGSNDFLKIATTGNITLGVDLADSEVSDTLTSSLFVGSGSSTTAVDLATAEVAGTLPIATGGTGNTTATAAFDALAPTTTRGDVITRGASSNGRLALGGKGRSLVSDGTDTVYDYAAIYDLNQFGTFNASGVNFGGGGILNNTVASGTTSATNNTAGAAVNYATAATTGSDAGIVSFASIRILDNKYVALIKFQLQTTATVRAFVGFCDSATIANCMGADDPTQRMAGLQFSTNRGDTNFQFVTDDNTTQTVTNTSTAVDTNVHFLKIDASSGTSIIYTLYDSSGTQQATSTQSTNLPTATTAFSFYIANETLANSAASIRSYNGRLQSKLL